jgi:hypothetical protein
MSKETVEKMTSFENITEEKLAEAVKASKKENTSEQKVTISICDTAKDSTSEIIEKMDSKTLTYVQLYSGLYKKYLHMMDHFLGAWYVAQKELISKSGMNDTSSAIFDIYLESVKQMALSQMDMNESMAKSYVEFRLSVLDSYDEMMTRAITNFSKMLSEFNVFRK